MGSLTPSQQNINCFYIIKEKHYVLKTFSLAQINQFATEANDPIFILTFDDPSPSIFYHLPEMIHQHLKGYNIILTTNGVTYAIGK